MALSRQRTRYAPGKASGVATRVTPSRTQVIRQSHTFTRYESVCNDFTGRDSDHELNIERITREIQNLNGIRYDTYPVYYRKYSNHDLHGLKAVDGHIGLGWPNVLEAATKVRALTNPSRPVVSVPTMIAEAKDFINPIRLAGLTALKKKKLSQVLRRKGRIKESADAYLSYKFAIEPTIRDLASLLNVQESIAKRMGELDRLASKGGLKRKLQIFQGVGSDTGSSTVESALGIIFSNRTDVITTARTWGSIRWKPIMGVPWKNAEEKAQLATNLVLGMNAHNLVQATWELVPWSFMVDWFANVGDFIAAGNNTVPVTASHVNVMQHRKTTISWTRSDSNKEFSGGSAVFTRETKRRDVEFGSGLVLSLPFLNGGQLSILGALSASRMSR